MARTFDHEVQEFVDSSRNPSGVTRATPPGRKKSRDVSASDLSLANLEHVEGRGMARTIDPEDRKFNGHEHVEERDMTASNQVTDLEG
jgi:hypothetical protein